MRVVSKMVEIEVNKPISGNPGLEQIHPYVPKTFIDKKNYYGVSWAILIKEGIQALELKETLMTGKHHEDNWRDKSRRLLAECLEAELNKREQNANRK